MNRSTLCVCLIILTAMFLACGVDPTTDAATKRYYTARVAAKDAVRSLLVSPSSAEFSDWHVEWDNPKNQATVTGIVESKNRFGVMLQSQFMVIVQFDNDDKKTRVLDAKVSAR